MDDSSFYKKENSKNDSININSKEKDSSNNNFIRNNNKKTYPKINNLLELKFGCYHLNKLQVSYVYHANIIVKSIFILFSTIKPYNLKYCKHIFTYNCLKRLSIVLNYKIF
ncbi:hypothetical protein EDEG_02443 [Edhazardia aedis USNM 41457]|uniref:Uncharacterized protein n=1 Tax=Edhazardia aedis (strain USNM 41457) TaxID=1003232 RepID=J9DKS2_EDHAE|nr:hypothetical protein EDEG_02443 [Edhazardia aedis USNM 41457]|eukprot:EJW03190.1 hypothetical protein EDEG_02443 [Edhazardia aedis USNM 41457]